MGSTDIQKCERCHPNNSMRIINRHCSVFRENANQEKLHGASVGQGCMLNRAVNCNHWSESWHSDILSHTPHIVSRPARYPLTSVAYALRLPISSWYAMARVPCILSWCKSSTLHYGSLSTKHLWKPFGVGLGNYILPNRAQTLVTWGKVFWISAHSWPSPLKSTHH